MPVAICPACRTISLDRTHKEWIQMSPFAKLCAIYPRASIYGIFGGMAATALSFQKVSAMESLGGLTGWILGGIFVVTALIVMYVTLCFAVNSSFFIRRYIASVKRTRNQKYRQIINQFGKTYDENLPLFLRFSGKSRSDIDFNLRKPTLDEDVRIPTLDDSILNA